MKNNNPTGRGGFKEGKSGNPGGMPVGLKKDMSDFKQAMFNLFKFNQKKFEKAALADPVETLKLLVRLCPQEVTGEDGGSIGVRILIEDACGRKIRGSKS